MLIAGLRRRCIRGIACTGFACSLLLGGCTLQGLSQPAILASEVNLRLAALDTCIARAQQLVARAMAAGISGGPLAPANSSIADAQDALEAARALLQQQQAQTAEVRIAQGLEVCESVEPMIAKACKDAAERKTQTQLSHEAETRFAAIATCLEAARSVVEKAYAAQGQTAQTSTARSALESAEAALAQARQAMTHNDPKGALGRLEAAETACQLAQESGVKAIVPLAPSTPPAPARRSW